MKDNNLPRNSTVMRKEDLHFNRHTAVLLPSSGNRLTLTSEKEHGPKLGLKFMRREPRKPAMVSVTGYLTDKVILGDAGSEGDLLTHFHSVPHS
ncbi:hypothetical protein Y032_0058g2949 [Ancylostoma ceylanicum]|uniref:Uncharacterized protein n=2 Tax=Ancylostoma ceylanicum TaxID=53326 RepID=A0A016U519_9BILA|nr:hypothetical protein Y032_0058g2949 [Ancylostoma ceylanicum]